MQLTKNILLRGIPATLHKRMKMKALQEDKTLTRLIVDALEYYLKNGRKKKSS